MQWSAILRFIKDEENDFNHCVENMSSVVYYVSDNVAEYSMLATSPLIL